MGEMGWDGERGGGGGGGERHITGTASMYTHSLTIQISAHPLRTQLQMFCPWQICKEHDTICCAAFSL